MRCDDEKGMMTIDKNDKKKRMQIKTQLSRISERTSLLFHRVFKKKKKKRTLEEKQHTHAHTHLYIIMERALESMRLSSSSASSAAAYGGEESSSANNDDDGSNGGGEAAATTTTTTTTRMNANEIDSDENQSDEEEEEEEDVFEDASTTPEEETNGANNGGGGEGNNARESKNTSGGGGGKEEEEEEKNESEEDDERVREEDFSELLRYVKVAVDDENPLEKYEKLGSTLWQLSNDALEQLANREEIEGQQGVGASSSDNGERSIFSIVNEEEEEDEANVSKDGGLNLQDLPNCVQLAAKELSVFAKALTIDPGMAYRPGSSKTREVIPGETTMRAIGSHRVGAAEIIAMMLQLGCLEIDEKMAHLKLEETNDESKPMTLETLAIMLFEYPWSSAFHAAASRAILAALSSPHEKLWMPLVVCARDEGMGDVYKNSLPTKVAETMNEALLCKRVSERKGNVGSAVVLANALREFGEATDEERSEMRKHLNNNPKWLEANKDGGSLDRLNEEQVGGLCGPKPTRSQFLETNLGGGGSVISSHELLRMLQHISLGGGGN